MTKLPQTAEIRERIERAAKKLGLNADSLRREFGNTIALAEMLEQEVIKRSS